MLNTITDLSKFDRLRVLVVGDLMLDEYVWGEVERISPEAPVQIVSVLRDDYTLGGAGNVINNLVTLGATVFAGGVIGTLEDGDRLLAQLQHLNVETGGIIRQADRPTTRKTRIIAANQHVLRLDRESRQKVSGETLQQLRVWLEASIPQCDIVLVSDYAKGVITDALMNHLVGVCHRHSIPCIADPKGLDFSKYAGVSVLTPNKKEAGIASGIDISDDDALVRAGKKILNTIPIENLLITCGKDGMVLFEGDQLPYTIPAEARQVFDVSGAGDTVLSVLGMALASGNSLKDAAKLANTAGGIVVGKVGTATVTRTELMHALKRDEEDSLFKYKSLAELSALVSDLKRKGKRIVMTNGCFDLLHVGHIMLFSAAKKLADKLIVAIDDDASVRRIKGNGRPVIGERERVRILSAIDTVDFVVTFSSDELKALIQKIRPDVLIKGSNYRQEDVIGRELVQAYGGQVVLFPIIEQISSTGIINAIKNI